MKHQNIIKPQRLVYESLLFSSKKFPDKVALITEGQPHTYRELYEAAVQMASALQERGIQRGDRCVIYMDNTWECAVSIYGALMAGGVFVVVNPQTKAEKLSYILRDCAASAFISDNHLKGGFLKAISAINSLVCVISSGDKIDDQAIKPEIEQFDEVIQGARKQDLSQTVIPSDLSALIYTSGSTGDPKGVMHTHLSMLFAVGSLVEYLRLRPEDKILVVLPFAFDYGLYQLLMAVHVGSTLVIERSFTYPAQIFNRIEEESVSVFPAVPTIFSMIMAAHEREKLEFSNIRMITNTAAALPAEHIPKLQEIFPNALIFKMYGLTECKRVSYLEPELINEKPKSVGKAIPGTEVYIQKENGELAGPDEKGVLYIRGPHIMLGYWNQPEQSADVISEGRYPSEKVLCSKDWFKMDAEGFLYFLGRSDDIIKTRGEKVSPIEVENTLHGLKGVREAAVIGVTDELFGSAIKAFVALESEDISAREIKKYCMSKLENFMVPKEIIIMDELPKTNTGKISKKDLV